MYVLHFEGPAELPPREWLDAGHPALAAHLQPDGLRLVRPLLLGGHGDTHVVLPGLAPLHATLAQPRPGEVEVQPASPAAPVRLDGALVTGPTPLAEGAALQLGPWTVRLYRTEPLSPARQQRLAALGSDPAAWRVLADELEESGDSALAAWLRLERSVTPEARSQLRVLGSEVPLSQRAQVASAAVLNCERPDGECPGRWDRLLVDAEPCLRACGACGKTAVYCEDELEAAHFAMRGDWRVVLDAGRPQPRRPWPMLPTR